MPTSLSPDAVDLHPALSAVDRVAEEVRAASADMDRYAHVPARLLAALEAAGLFDLLTPESLGGGDVPIPVALAVYERLAGADAGVAWRVWNGNFGFLGAMLDRTGRDMIWSDHDRPRFANAGQPGEARRTAGGWTVDGRWALVSGADTAEWFVFGAVVEDGEGTTDLPPGTVLRVPLHVDQVQVRGDWDGTGLRGAGNRAVVAVAAEVPDEVVTIMRPAPGRPGQQGFPPAMRVIPGATAVTLGVARGALDLAAERLRTDAPRGADPVHLMRLARADAGLRAARHGLLAAAQSLQDRRTAEQPVADVDRGRLTASMAFAAEVARDALEAAAALAGSEGLRRGTAIERMLRDGATALRHGNQADTLYPAAGADLLTDRD